ncbi:hypothetical protein RBG61_00420 [Paludicola sp. MB14-C6]|uniref:hypothetical protein n=1 Tax=Paludihabitans sp. MB14-C6 TaxID=3070656 RepID=UPI0027DE9FFD|nr:hypothetical protein [Paludicola sp. MB14-C6]WMJ23155.1 hypothetical protein RBG61_00420 [Paludicola sp. MB14-C6]
MRHVGNSYDYGLNRNSIISTSGRYQVPASIQMAGPAAVAAYLAGMKKNDAGNQATAAVAQKKKEAEMENAVQATRYIHQHPLHLYPPLLQAVILRIQVVRLLQVIIGLRELITFKLKHNARQKGKELQKKRKRKN